MLLPERHASDESYRYGFNGKEKDNEMKGEGVQYDYGFRIYDARLGKFLSQDPLFKSYPWYTPYQFAGNKPIWATDLDGLEEYIDNQVRIVHKIFVWNQGRTTVNGNVQVSYKKGDKIITKTVETGTHVLNEGYEGGPLRIDRIDYYARPFNSANGVRRYIKIQRLVDWKNATLPKPSYEPEITIKEEEPVISVVRKKTPIIVNPKPDPVFQPGTEFSGDDIVGRMYPYMDGRGFLWRDPNTNSYGLGAKEFLSNLADGLNKSPLVKELIITSSVNSGSLDPYKVRVALVQGLQRLQEELYKLGMRRPDLKITINHDKLDVSKNSDGKTTFEFKN
ncbi:hypothetical protein H2O64_15395 [Kordia sp. YSTF-M3]|uniref:RHS repeat-associated core domain-containing protein n=2 Tax=Kordia aestuariivivens TaxID=2759037 RepID=A0ABR7QBX1_9FLAO|nr:hypothetical protein [Kordia aestuariivivens]